MILRGKTIAVSGISGLVGSALAAKAAQWGCSFLPLVRTRELSACNSVYWNYREGTLDSHGLEGIDAVVHLAGESIAAMRWNRTKMREIEQSRVESTSFLASRLSRLTRPPGAFICASATGFYGSRGDEILDESSSPGESFLAQVCRNWESACSPNLLTKTRVVNLRIGMVLDSSGGALPSMLPVFRMGAGGKLGNGRQWNSWIHLQDLVDSIGFCLVNKLHGPINAVAPEPVTNGEFTRILASRLNRPARLHVPSFLLRLLAGRVADELLLTSCRAVPSKLLQHGFSFKHSNLEQALKAILPTRS